MVVRRSLSSLPSSASAAPLPAGAGPRVAAPSHLLLDGAAHGRRSASPSPTSPTSPPGGIATRDSSSPFAFLSGRRVPRPPCARDPRRPLREAECGIFIVTPVGLGLAFIFAAASTSVTRAGARRVLRAPTCILCRPLGLMPCGASCPLIDLPPLRRATTCHRGCRAPSALGVRLHRARYAFASLRSIRLYRERGGDDPADDRRGRGPAGRGDDRGRRQPQRQLSGGNGTSSCSRRSGRSRSGRARSTAAAAP